MILITSINTGVAEVWFGIGRASFVMTGILRGCLKTGWNSNGGGRGLDSIGDSAAGGTRLRVHAPLTVSTIRAAFCALI